MPSLYQRLGSIVKGVLSGFDRIVFKGCIRPLMYEAGVASFLQSQGVLNKEYKAWALAQTKTLIDDAEALSQNERQESIKPIVSAKIRKEKLAREQQDKLGITEGLIGVWWAMEVCNTYKAKFSTTQTYPRMTHSRTKCKHLYFYFDHPEFGFMNIRLQTWFPFHIQIAMNGREWLRRSLAREGIGFNAHRNKFLHIDDMKAAQALLTRQLDTDWPKMLSGFLPTVFPSKNTALGGHLSYYWTLWQSEWATDYLFTSYKELAPLGERLLRHAFMTGTGERVLRYLDRPFTHAGKPYASNGNDVSSRLLAFQDGLRVRHWVDQNSVKVYTEQNVLRVETTINNPGMFKIYRHREGERKDAPKQLRKMRKGVADVVLRAKISQGVNDRLAAQLCECRQTVSLSETLEKSRRRRKSKGRSIRALDVMGKDRELLLAIADPVYSLGGMTNRELRGKLKVTLTGLTEKQASGKVSRLLRLLRDHGIIRKLPRQRRYRLSAHGAQMTTALAAALSASTEELMGIAA